ncbi:ATP-binding protein [Myxococcota bacterium]|nr:ATP-binding protein [Myxococcota bacterium]
MKSLEALDLSSCEREPIHVSGAIQPHGALLAVDLRGGNILQVSANTDDLLGRPVASLLGQPLDTIFDHATITRIERTLDGGALRSLNPVPVDVDGRRFEGVVHRSGPVVIVELEPLAATEPEPQRDRVHELYAISRDALVRFQRIDALDHLLDATAEEVRRFTGFDRVLVYRFEDDDRGVVEAEARRDDVESFLGLHYPASDIPAQARALYRKNWLRLIADVGYRPVPLVPQRCPLTNEPLDLSLSVLRSVSPVHVEYLTNMGVSASMSISLIVGGRLWGMIACHHYTPKLVPLAVRMACELVGQVVSLQIHALVDREVSQAHAKAAGTIAQLVHAMSEVGVVAALVGGRPSALDLVPAGGVAVWFDGELSTAGTTPPLEELRALVEWLQPKVRDGTWSTDSLARERFDGERIVESASGALATSLGADADQMIVWLRPEVISTVRWGGDPDKPAEQGPEGLRLSPRRSFEVWKQELRRTAAPWTTLDRDAATELARATNGIILRRSAQIARLNVELERAVRARDEFMSMASHELRTPVTTLHLQLDRITRAAAQRPDEVIGTPRIRDAMAAASRQVERLERLVSAMLDVSRVAAGRLELDRTDDVDVGAIVRDVVVRFDAVLDGIPVHLTVDSDAKGSVDPLRVEQIVANLLSNAVKYGQGSPITIRVDASDDWISIAISDRGIGIPAEEQSRLFQRFERARSASAHPGGFGLGLWIVRQFVNAHGGTISVDSRAGAGATFTVRLPRRTRTEGPT